MASASPTDAPPVVFIDSNIPMYLVGADHPLKLAARDRLERLITAETRLVTDAEVLQEILHRYAAIKRLDAIAPAFDAVLGIVDEVFPVSSQSVLEAKELLLGTLGLSARDALHVAVMNGHGIRRILSFDAGFDRVPGIVRLGADS